MKFIDITIPEYNIWLSEMYYDLPEFKQMLIEINSINEMTLIKDITVSRSFNFYKKMLSNNGKKVGDQNGRDIIFLKGPTNKIILGIKDGEEFISVIVGQKTNLGKIPVFVILQSVTDEKYKKQGLMKYLYAWVKNNLKLSITNTGQQSQEAIKFYDNLSKDSNFKLSWYNTRTGEREPYIPNEDKKYRSEKQKTEWITLLEANIGWYYGSSRNPYGHMNEQILLDFEDKTMNEDDQLKYCWVK